MILRAKDSKLLRMVKTLYLMRHAHAIDADSHVDDFHRPLSEHGQQQCVQAAQVLLQCENLPKRIIASSAVRTSQTALALSKAQCFEAANIIKDELLYLATSQELHVFIQQLPEESDCVMLVGHNPGLYELVVLLAKTFPDTLQQQGLPTCGVVQLTFEVNHWYDVKQARAEITGIF